MSSRAEVRVRVMGEYRFSSLLKQNKRLKFASSFTSPDFFFKKISVMKCLRSKKRLNGADSTTYRHTHTHTHTGPSSKVCAYFGP